MSAPLYARVLTRRFTFYQKFPKRCHVNNISSNDSNFKMKLADRLLQINVGELAKFANGSAVAQYGDTSVLVTAVSKQTHNPEDFLPLTVNYRQKAAAAGRIPTNHLRRELGTTDKEILTSRVIDRALRPLFPKELSTEVQIICNLLAVDGVNDPDIVSINAASAALMMSDIPWNGPVAAVRIGYIDNKVVINPTRQQREQSSLDLTLACTESSVVMIEAAGDSVPVSVFTNAVQLGLDETGKICRRIANLSRRKGKEKQEVTSVDEISEEVADEVRRCCATDIENIFYNHALDKTERGKVTSTLREAVVDDLLCNFPDTSERTIRKAFDELYKETFRNIILTKGIRNDGRKPTDIRDIECKVDMYQPLHGSALFQRGQTQVLCTVTFDSPRSAARVDPVSQIISGYRAKNFMLHYEFPPYATNEIGRVGGAGNRREIGHGALAEKALMPLIPKDYPFTIRLTSEVLESAGSSSMASVCGGSMALMDAGVPILEPAAGVAIGLVSNPYRNPNSWRKTDYRLLTDIQGLEDYLGDMDFKIAGTTKGITALQADIKLGGLPVKVVTEAVKQGIDAYKKIIKIMEKTIDRPRESHKETGPVIKNYEVPLNVRHKFIGVGGSNLEKIYRKTGVTLESIDETQFQIYAPNKDAMHEAMEMIEKNIYTKKEITLEPGAIYTGKITELRDSGVFIQLHPDLQPQFIPTNQLDVRKVNHPFALDLEEGQELTVKYFGLDPATGKARLSRKVLQMTSQRIRRNIESTNTADPGKS